MLYLLLLFFLLQNHVKCQRHFILSSAILELFNCCWEKKCSKMINFITWTSPFYWYLVGKNRCVFHMNIRYSLQQKDIFACQTGNLNLREKKKRRFPPKTFFCGFRKSKILLFSAKTEERRRQKICTPPLCVVSSYLYYSLNVQYSINYTVLLVVNKFIHQIIYSIDTGLFARSENETICKSDNW